MRPSCGTVGAGVDRAHRRHRAPRVARSSRRRERVAALARVGVALERGRRGAEHDGNAEALRATHGHVARRVAQALLLLVRGIVLLVDDDEPEVAERREHREPRSEHDARGARLRGEPRRGALALVAGGCAPRRAPRAGKRLRTCASSCGVRPISGTSSSAWRPARERCRDELQVDLGLAAAGDALQQDRMEAPDARAARARSPRAAASVSSCSGAKPVGPAPAAGAGGERAARAPGAGAAGRLAAITSPSGAVVVVRAEAEQLEQSGSSSGGTSRTAALDRLQPRFGGPRCARRARPPRRPCACARTARRRGSRRALRSPSGTRKSKLSSSGTSRATRAIFKARDPSRRGRKACG